MLRGHRYNKDQLMDIVSQRIRESEREVEMASGNESDTAGKGSNRIPFLNQTSNQSQSIPINKVKKIKNTINNFPLDEDAPAALTYFQKAAVELCARKVASRSGDVRKCLDICG